MAHSRADGHEVQGSTEPLVIPVATHKLTEGRAEGDKLSYTLGMDIDQPGADLILSVYFEDGEVVTERLNMSGMLGIWIGEIAHSKRMRDVFPEGHQWPESADG